MAAYLMEGGADTWTISWAHIWISRPALSMYEFLYSIPACSSHVQRRALCQLREDLTHLRDEIIAVGALVLRDVAPVPPPRRAPPALVGESAQRRRQQVAAGSR